MSPEATPPGSSKTVTVYRRLRGDVLAGRLAPGDRLRIAELALALGVNAAAIREALQRLASEKLAVWRDQRGFIVAPLSLQDLHDLTETRIGVEVLALRMAIRRGDAAWEGAVLAAAHHLRRTGAEGGPPADVAEAWARRHARFHTALVSGCGNARLLQLHAELYEQSERYRALSLRVGVRGDREVAQEHQDLVDAALDRDEALAAELIAAHLQRTTDTIAAAAERGLIPLA